MNKTKLISLATAIWLSIICFPNIAAGQEWKSALSTAKKNTNKEYDDGGKYKGQLSNGNREGLGLYSWANGTYYFGNWSNGNMTGYGINLVPEGLIVSNCENCVVYVGNFKTGMKSGKGTCYDKAGKLIYYGDFADSKPTETYPSTNDLSSYTFETISYNSGDSYIGEAKDGKRHGAGIYVWSNGNVWYGRWENGNRNGSGIQLGYNASWKTEKCDVDDCTKYASSEDYALQQQQYQQQQYQQPYQQQQQRNEVVEALDAFNAVLGTIAEINNQYQYNKYQQNQYRNNQHQQNQYQSNQYQNYQQDNGNCQARYDKWANQAEKASSNVSRMDKGKSSYTFAKKNLREVQKEMRHLRTGSECRGKIARKNYLEDYDP